jgi:pyrrolidone-carboxylate peptidase
LGSDVVRVLITGFGPFPGAPFNPSAALAKALARRRRPAFAGIERAVQLLSELRTVAQPDAAMLSVALRELRNLA